MSTTPDILMECRELGRDYGRQSAVRDVSFSLRRGEVLAFLGPNGAGKSTTMNMLTGCLAPSHGAVSVAGIDLLEDPRAAKARIGYLPEHPPLYPELTVDEYLRHAARLRGVGRRALAGAVSRVKAHCGLEAEGRRPLGQLSRGYQQRAGIAQALIHDPDVVILDEPTVGLDPNQVREIRELIRTLGQDHAVILSTHILPEVSAVCSRVQIMVDGRLVFEDDMASLGGTGSTRLRLRFTAPPDPTALWDLPGVESVERLDETDFLIHHRGSDEIAPEAAALAVKNGWGLAALTPERDSLEEIFTRYSSRDSDSTPRGTA